GLDRLALTAADDAATATRAELRVLAVGAAEQGGDVDLQSRAEASELVEGQGHLVVFDLRQGRSRKAGPAAHLGQCPAVLASQRLDRRAGLGDGRRGQGLLRRRFFALLQTDLPRPSCSVFIAHHLKFQPILPSGTSRLRSCLKILAALDIFLSY